MNIRTVSSLFSTNQVNSAVAEPCVITSEINLQSLRHLMMLLMLVWILIRGPLRQPISHHIPHLHFDRLWVPLPPPSFASSVHGGNNSEWTHYDVAPLIGIVDYYLILILLIFVHWLLDDHLHKISPSVCVSGVDSSSVLVDRPFGGCSILYCKSLFSCVTPLILFYS